MPTAFNDLAINDLWEPLRARLDTATMRAILNVTGSAPKRAVYIAGVDDYTAPEGAEGTDWGRLVVIPTQTLWPTPDVPGETRKVGFLLRAEFNDFTADGYHPEIGLDLAQREAYRQVDGWAPTGLDGLLVALPFYRWRAPQPTPLRDEDRGVLFLSSEYRTELSAPAP